MCVQDAICTSLSEYNAHIEELKKEMKGATDSARNIRADIQEIRNKYLTTSVLESLALSVDTSKSISNCLPVFQRPSLGMYQSIHSKGKSKIASTAGPNAVIIDNIKHSYTHDSVEILCPHSKAYAHKNMGIFYVQSKAEQDICIDGGI